MNKHEDRRCKTEDGRRETEDRNEKTGLIASLNSKSYKYDSSRLKY